VQTDVGNGVYGIHRRFKFAEKLLRDAPRSLPNLVADVERLTHARIFPALNQPTDSAQGKGASFAPRHWPTLACFCIESRFWGRNTCSLCTETSLFSRHPPLTTREGFPFSTKLRLCSSQVLSLFCKTDLVRDGRACHQWPPRSSTSI